MNHTIYLVLLNWNAEESDGIETFMYTDRSAAYKKYRNLIADARDPNVSPLGQVFDEDEKPKDGYELHSNGYKRGNIELYWHLMKRCHHDRYYFVDLKRAGLKGEHKK